MGYTHYWAFDPDAPSTDAGFARTAADAARIIAAAGIALAREDDDPDVPPEVTAEVIRFNGIGEDGHEPFLLLRDPARWATRGDLEEAAKQGYWEEFCKTNWKPYDLVACAILIRAHQHMPDAFVFDSDGDWEDESWLAARDLLARVFGAEAAPTQDPMGYTEDGPPSTTRRR